MKNEQVNNKKDVDDSQRERDTGEEILNNILKPIWFVIGIIFFIVSIYFFVHSYSFMNNVKSLYDENYGGMDKKYVGADAFNYIIAGTYSTTIMLRAVFFAVLGVGCFLMGKKQNCDFQ